MWVLSVCLGSSYMRLRAAVSIAVLTLLSACGEAEVPTGNIVTPKEGYIRLADALCLDYRDAATGAALAYRDASAKERAKIRRRLAAKAEKVQDKLEALPRPESEGQELLDPFFKKTRKQVEALRAGKQVDVPGLDKLADRYGFDVCGQSGA
jgi:hypothetical protein